MEPHVLFVAMQSLIDKEPRPVVKVPESKVVALEPVSDSIRKKIEGNDPEEGSYAAVHRERTNIASSSDTAEYKSVRGMVFPNVGALLGEMSEFLYEKNVRRLQSTSFLFCFRAFGPCSCCASCYSIPVMAFYSASISSFISPPDPSLPFPFLPPLLLPSFTLPPIPSFTFCSFSQMRSFLRGGTRTAWDSSL